MVASGVSMSKSCAKIRLARQATLLRQEARVAEGEGESALSAFVEGPGKQMVGALCERVPELRPWSDKLVPFPMQGVVAATMVPSSGQTAEDVMGWCNANQRTPAAQAWLSSLRESWARDHRMIMSSECKPLPEGTGDTEDGKCLRFGRCLCDERGRRVKLLGNSLLKLLKVFCPARSSARDRLVNGELLIHLAGRHAAQPGQRNAPGNDAPTASGATASGQSVTLHVSLMYLSPWRPTYQRMQVQQAGGVMRLKATCDFVTHWAMCAELDLDLQWSVSLLEFVKSSRPLGQLCPAEIAARRCTDLPLSQELQVWPKQRQRGSGWGAKLPRPKATQPSSSTAAGAEHALGDADGSASDVESEGNNSNPEGDKSAGDIGAQEEDEAPDGDPMPGGHVASLSETDPGAHPTKQTDLLPPSPRIA